MVAAAKPDVFNHNLETVPSRYLTVRPGARYFHSIRLLQRVKEIDPTIFTKSGIMVGLGEERHEVLQVMDDLRSAEVDFLTIGQYLQPTRKHHAVMRYVTPDEFAGYEKVAYTKGFLMVSASPLTRSSHHAGEDFAKLQAARCGSVAALIASESTTNATRSCHGIVGVRQVDICSTAVGHDRHSLRFAGCAVLETRLGRPPTMPSSDSAWPRSRDPAALGHGW